MPGLSVPGNVKKLPLTHKARSVTVTDGQLILADTPGAGTAIDLAPGKSGDYADDDHYQDLRSGCPAPGR